MRMRLPLMAVLAVCAVRCAGSEPVPADMVGRVQEGIPLEDEMPVAGVTLRLIEANGIQMRIAEAGQVGPMVLNVNGDPKRFSSYRLPIIKDVLSGFHGPLAGILTGLDWAKKNAPDVDYIATFATDSPFFPSTLVDFLYKTIKEGHVLACAKSNGRHHPVFGLWPVDQCLALQDALVVENIRKIDIWTSRYKMGTVDFPTDQIDPFFNVNTPEDLAQARDFLNQLK